MESLLSQIEAHGYPILFLAVFIEAVGLPIPAALALLIAGAACARGSMNLALALGGSLLVLLIADVLMFLLGRYTGWWLLAKLCRLSMNPDSCILRSADSFHRRGRTLLVFAKFVPGINTIAQPMAGSMNMRLRPFLLLDSAGILLYVGAYFFAGYLFSDALGIITGSYQLVSRLLSWALIAAVVFYAAMQWRLWRKSRSEQPVPGVTPHEAAQQVSNAGAVIFDVRSHGYYDTHAKRIQGSRRLDPNALNQSLESIPKDQLVYLYCTCAGDATSLRVTRALIEKGIQASVIRGGLRGWKKAGLPIEPVPSDEMELLPTFD